MNLYIGCKVIKGESMDEQTFLETHKNVTTPVVNNRPGYLVEYPDGYKSWSPKEVFEGAYRKVTQEELDLISGKV